MTFVWILLPGVAVGVLLALADYQRTRGGRRGRRWLALSPLLLTSVLFSRRGDIASLFEDGVGGARLVFP